LKLIFFKKKDLIKSKKKKLSPSGIQQEFYCNSPVKLVVYEFDKLLQNQDIHD